MEVKELCSLLSRGLATDNLKGISRANEWACHSGITHLSRPFCGGIMAKVLMCAALMSCSNCDVDGTDCKRSLICRLMSLDVHFCSNACGVIEADADSCIPPALLPSVSVNAPTSKRFPIAAPPPPLLDGRPAAAAVAAARAAAAAAPEPPNEENLGCDSPTVLYLHGTGVERRGCGCAGERARQ